MCFYWLEITVWSNLSLEHFDELNYLHSTWSQGAVKTPLSEPTRRAWELWHNWNDTHKDVLSKKNHQFSSKIDVTTIRTPVFIFHFPVVFWIFLHCLLFSLFYEWIVWKYRNMSVTGYRRKTEDNSWVPSSLCPAVARSLLLFLLLCISSSRLDQDLPKASPSTSCCGLEVLWLQMLLPSLMWTFGTNLGP